MNDIVSKDWEEGEAPVAVVMISLNEAHNMEEVCSNLKGWAKEVFLVDSYSQDQTVDIALSHGVHVVQRRFRGFGDQWNFALNKLPITAPWTMKVDPDERLSDKLKASIVEAIEQDDCDGIEFTRRWWFMGRQLPVHDRILRVWRTGECVFSDVSVNEHPKVKGNIVLVRGEMEHHDSPDLDHWLEKQNRYTTAEAVNAIKNVDFSDTPRLFGTTKQRRMWVKKHFIKIPFRYQLLFLYYWIWCGAWREGWVGYTSSQLWTDVMRLIEYKKREIQITGRMPIERYYGPGKPDERIKQFD